MVWFPIKAMVAGALPRSKPAFFFFSWKAALRPGSTILRNSMENKASKTRSSNIAFVMDAALLARLVTILREAGDSLEYTVKFSDGTSVQYSNEQEILDQPNSTRRAITSLIAGATKD